MTSRNQQLFERAQKHIPGGVNSPVRAFRSVGGTPLFFQKGAGAKVQDADGKWYTDYVGSWGPMIVGHNHPSGNPEPSAADRAVTVRLKQALALVDVRVIDHFVVAGDQCVSFAERGLL